MERRHGQTERRRTPRFGIRPVRKAVQTRVHIRRFDVDARTPPVPAARPACRPETLRGTSDLTFDFVASGTGIDENGEQYANGHWRHHLSRSDWIEQLRNVGPREILLLEVPIPLEGTADGLASHSHRPPARGGTVSQRRLPQLRRLMPHRAGGVGDLHPSGSPRSQRRRRYRVHACRSAVRDQPYGRCGGACAAWLADRNRTQLHPQKRQQHTRVRASNRPAGRSAQKTLHSWTEEQGRFGSHMSCFL